MKKDADVIVIEKASNTITNEMVRILKSKNKNKYIELVNFINRVSFQIIFTLAIIQDKYPSFVHNDFFLRNILGTTEKHEVVDYIEYNYNNKKYYLPANGFSVKINDFGYTLSKPNMISTAILYNDHTIGGMPNLDCNKCDIFNFFHDMYDGGDLGAKSTMTLMKQKSKKSKKLIRNCYKKYIDVTIIDKINKINKKGLDRTWSVKNIDFLEKTIQTPHEYLNSNIFNKYCKLPTNYNIVATYGHKSKTNTNK